MSNRPIRDEWLLPILEGLVDRAAIDQLRQQGIESLWEAVVNGEPEYLFVDNDVVTTTVSFDVVDGRIIGVTAVLNPDKLLALRARLP